MDLSERRSRESKSASFSLRGNSDPWSKSGLECCLEKDSEVFSENNILEISAMTSSGKQFGEPTLKNHETSGEFETEYLMILRNCYRFRNDNGNDVDEDAFMIVYFRNTF